MGTTRREITLLVGAQLTSGLVIAGASSAIEYYGLRQFPRFRALCQRHKVLAIGTSILVTMVVSATVGASGVPVLIGQSASTVLSVTTIYREPGLGETCSAVLLDFLRTVDRCILTSAVI